MAGYSSPAWVNGASPAINASNLLALSQAVELAQHPFGVCSTAAATKAKTVTIDYSGTLALFQGLTVVVKFSNSNTASAPTLNVNGTGAKLIKSYGTTAATTWVAGQVINFVYDGTNWLFDGIDAYTKAQNLSSAAAADVQNVSGALPANPSEAISALATAVANGMKCESGTYTGSGSYGSGNKNSLTFPFVPKLVCVWHGPSSPNGLHPDDGMGYWHYSFLWMTGQTQAGVHANGSGILNFSVSGKTLYWYTGAGSSVQMNDTNTTYYYFALGV